MIRDVHPGYGSGLFTHPGSRGQKGPRSRGQKAPYPYPLHWFSSCFENAAV
jgi:hypothetical protein